MERWGAREAVCCSWAGGRPRDEMIRCGRADMQSFAAAARQNALERKGIAEERGLTSSHAQKRIHRCADPTIPPVVLRR